MFPRLLVILSFFALCFALPANAGTDTVNFTDPSGAARAAIVITPATVTAPLPLVILLHGGNMNPQTEALDSHYPSSLWASRANAGEFVLAAPWGTGDSPGPTPSGASWNDCTTDDGRTGDDEGAILALISLLQTTTSIDPSRIYVVGSSQGGNMALRLAAQRPDLFAAAASVAGLNASRSECVPPTLPIPVMIFSGTKDKIIPYDGSVGTYQSYAYNLSAPATFAQWQSWNGIAQPANVTTFNYKNVALFDGGTAACATAGAMRQETVLCTLTGGGHTEPSLTKVMSLLAGLVLGPQNRDLEYVTEVWSFFQRHQLGVQ